MNRPGVRVLRVHESPTVSGLLYDRDGTERNTTRGTEYQWIWEGKETKTTWVSEFPGLADTTKPFIARKRTGPKTETIRSVFVVPVFVV